MRVIWPINLDRGGGAGGTGQMPPLSPKQAIAGALVGPAGHANSIGHGNVLATAEETHANPSMTTSSSPYQNCAARSHRAPIEVECQDFVCAPDRSPVLCPRVRTTTMPDSQGDR